MCRRLYRLISFTSLIVMLLCESELSVKAENTSKVYAISEKSITVPVAGYVAGLSVGGMSGTVENSILVSVPSLSSSEFDIERPINMNISYSLNYSNGRNSTLTYLGNSFTNSSGTVFSSSIDLLYGSESVSAGYVNGSYSYDFLYNSEVSSVLVNIFSCQEVKSATSISGLKEAVDTYCFSDIIITFSQEKMTELEITQQPGVDIYAENGEVVSFGIEAVGDELSYQWQSDSSGEWCDISYTGNTVSLSMSQDLDGCSYRCIVSDKYGNQLTSDEIILYYVTPLQITQQPGSDIYVEDGEAVNFGITAVGDGLTYQWQSNSSGTWSNVSYTSNTVSLNMNGGLSGCSYRCVVTDKYGNQLISNTVCLYMVITENDNISGAPPKQELNGTTIDLSVEKMVTDKITFSVDCDEYETFSGTTQIPIDISSIGFSNVKENDNVFIYGDFETMLFRFANQYTDVLSDELTIEVHVVDALGDHVAMRSTEESIHSDYIAFTARGPVTSMYIKLLFDAECKCKSSIYGPVSYSISAQFNNLELAFRHDIVDEEDTETEETETETESESESENEPETEIETESGSESENESENESESGSGSGSGSDSGNSEVEEGTEIPELTEDMKKFVGFMGIVIDFVKTDFTIYGHTFSYWQVIVLSCIGSIAGIFIKKVF